MRDRPRLAQLSFLLLASVPVMTRAPAIDWQSQTSGVTGRLRGVSAVSSRVAWASGADGTVLRTTDGGRRWERLPVPGAEKLDFRESSRIYKTTDGGAHWELQFANKDPKIFLDAMAFRDEAHGVAFSDSVDGRFVILTTANAGRAWERVPTGRLPPALNDEGAFAASGTNVAMSGRDHVWIGTTASRVLRSSAGDARVRHAARRIQSSAAAVRREGEVLESDFHIAVARRALPERSAL